MQLDFGRRHQVERVSHFATVHARLNVMHGGAIDCLIVYIHPFFARVAVKSTGRAQRGKKGVKII